MNKLLRLAALLKAAHASALDPSPMMPAETTVAIDEAMGIVLKMIAKKKAQLSSVKPAVDFPKLTGVK
jgi:hypothetical protein